MSYPPNHYGSGNRPPYPSSYGPPYPSDPNTKPVFAPSLGFRVDAPLYMPQPAYSPYPSSTSSPYPPSTSPYPSSTSPYPSSTSPYPLSGSSAHPPPPTGSVYPPSPSRQAPQSSHYSTSVYPPSPSKQPQQSSHYSTSVYPQSPPKQTYPSQDSSLTRPKSHAPYVGSYESNSRQPHQTHYNGTAVSYPNTPYPRSTQAINTNNSIYGSRPTLPKGTPTVIPANPFNPREDAEVLRKAMKGFGTDEKAIIYVLYRRSNAQRLQITVEFKTLYGKDLIKDLKSETSGKFEDLVVALMTPLPQFYAKELHDAIVGIGTDEEVLIEVLCTKSNNEIKTIRHAYHSMYNRSLEDDLRGDTSGTFKRLMVSLCNACRDESMVTNQAQAAEDARSLLRAGELRFGTDESTFNMVLCQRNFAQLRLIFEEYYKITGHDFEQAIKNEFSGNSKDGMLAIVRSIRNLPGFFAKCLHGAIAGLGTNDKTLIRVVTTRCEIDMGNIKQNYLAQYGETLADAIKGDTSGDYKKLLLALIGES